MPFQMPWFTANCSCPFGDDIKNQALKVHYVIFINYYYFILFFIVFILVTKNYTSKYKPVLL